VRGQTPGPRRGPRFLGLGPFFVRRPQPPRGIARAALALGRGGHHWSAWRETGSNRQLTLFLSYYHAWARTLSTGHVRKRKGVSADEAYQDALVGLWKAATKWDPLKASFTHYSKFWVVREMQRARELEDNFARVVAPGVEPPPASVDHEGEAIRLASEDLMELYEDYGFSPQVRAACDAVLSGHSLDRACQLTGMDARTLKKALEVLREEWAP
jgi:DNA-directed RNA polymerase specialized sigma24 family protein